MGVIIDNLLVINPGNLRTELLDLNDRFGLKVQFFHSIHDYYWAVIYDNNNHKLKVIRGGFGFDNMARLVKDFVKDYGNHIRC